MRLWNNANIINEMLKTFKCMGQSSRLKDMGESIFPESPVKKSFYDAQTPGLWMGNDGDCWISGSFMSSTRVLRKHISGIDVNGKDGYTSSHATGEECTPFEGGVAVKKLSDDSSCSGGAVVAGFNAGRTVSKNKTSLDYFDLNGDRFPDIVSGNTIQYTRSDGTLGKKHNYPGNGVRVSRSQTSNGGFSFSSEFPLEPMLSRATPLPRQVLWT